MVVSSRSCDRCFCWCHSGRIDYRTGIRQFSDSRWRMHCIDGAGNFLLHHGEIHPARGIESCGLSSLAMLRFSPANRQFPWDHLDHVGISNAQLSQHFRRKSGNSEQLTRAKMTTFHIAKGQAYVQASLATDRRHVPHFFIVCIYGR